MTSDDEKSLQERFAPTSVCFGCGPANERGLRIRSVPHGDEVVCQWRAQPWLEAWEGCLSGGIAGTLLDCHSNWSAAWTLYQRHAMSRFPDCVTADYAVRFSRPVSTTGLIVLRARSVEVREDRAVMEAILETEGKVCATCRGTFVAVRPGHTAYGRWQR